MSRPLALALALAAGLLIGWLGSRLHDATRSTPIPDAPAPAIASTAPAINSSVASQPDADELIGMEDGWPDTAPSPEQVLYAQEKRVAKALSALGPRVPDRPNLYLVTFAGDGSENVFHNEAEYASRLFTSRFGPSVHSVVLQNNPATLTSHPLASWTNLEAVLTGLKKVMDPQQDILLLYLTSHGDEDHSLLVTMDPLPLDQVDAKDLAGILQRHPMTWKVVVVNACYSGGFIPPLRGPGTLVMTAARADRSSFGCGADSDITYFGKAWLAHALNRSDDLIAAFKQARQEIHQWELQDDLPPSEPQIDIGKGIAEQLALWRKGLTPGPVVPFHPAKAAMTATAAPTQSATD